LMLKCQLKKVCLLLELNPGYLLDSNLFPLDTHDCPRHTHTQTWQSRDYQSLYLASFSK
jgi:hypothetical protein